MNRAPSTASRLPLVAVALATAVVVFTLSRQSPAPSVPVVSHELDARLVELEDAVVKSSTALEGEVRALRKSVKDLKPSLVQEAPACPSPAAPAKAQAPAHTAGTPGNGNVDYSNGNARYTMDCGPNGDCGGRGTCYIGRCFCKPGAQGTYCESGTLKDCASIPKQDDKLTCFFDPQYGSAAVDERTWRTALAAESATWAGMQATNDRSDEHTRGYGSYSAIPQGASLGHFAEFGCGPWTQAKTSLMAARPDLKFTSVTLLDPNLSNYVQLVPTCSYKSGRIADNIMTYLISAGAEAPLFDATFDTLLMTNVLEHVQDAYAVLHNLWRSLKPGGLLIFNDRYVDDFPFHSHIELNNVLHPVRVRKPVLDWLLSHFDEMYRNDAGTSEMIQRGDIGTYFIGRKK